MSKPRGWMPKPSEPARPVKPAKQEKPAGPVKPVKQQNSAGPEKPVEPEKSDVSYARRFGALLIDWLLCLLISGFFVKNRLVAGWVPPVILIVEYAFFIGLFAQTPGMFVAGIRCVSTATGGRIGIARAAVRGFLLCLVVPAILGWHDRVVGSVIVPGRRAQPPVA